MWVWKGREQVHTLALVGCPIHGLESADELVVSFRELAIPLLVEMNLYGGYLLAMKPEAPVSSTRVMFGLVWIWFLAGSVKCM